MHNNGMNNLLLWAHIGITQNEEGMELGDVVLK